MRDILRGQCFKKLNYIALFFSVVALLSVVLASSLQALLTCPMCTPLYAMYMHTCEWFDSVSQHPWWESKGTCCATRTGIYQLSTFSVNWLLVRWCVCVNRITTPCLKKTVQNCFCQNIVKFSPILIIFGRIMAKRLKLCKVHSLSTSPNSHHHTTVLNADVPNCYKTL